MLKAVTDADFDEQVLNSERLVLVDFWAPWCGPCKTLAPTLHALATEYEGLVEIAKVDVDDNAATRDRYGVRGIPMLALFSDGEVIARLNGVQSRARLSAFLDEHLGRHREQKSAPANHSAFWGDADVKASCIERLKRHIATKTVLTGNTMWDGETGSALGCSTEATEEECARVIGVPLDLVHVVDLLSTYYDSTAQGAEFALAWLEQVPVGADLSKLAPELLLEALGGDVVDRAVAADQMFGQLRAEMTSLLQSEIAARPSAGSAWPELRARVVVATQETTGAKRALGRALESACWSTVDSSATAQALVGITVIAMALEMERRGWSDADDSATLHRLEEISGEIVARGDALQPGAAMAVLSQENPVLARRHQEQYEARTSAMVELGRNLAASLLQRTKSAG